LARTVITGAGLLAVAGGIGRLFSLVSSPILTRVLGPSPYGVVALLGTVTSFATTAALLGVDLSYSRYFLAADPERAYAVERFCWRFAAGAAIAAATAAAAAWSLGVNGGLSESLAVMVALGTFLPAMNVMATTESVSPCPSSLLWYGDPTHGRSSLALPRASPPARSLPVFRPLGS
jgi:O-antigen/teichoic acid export membrane protein